MGLWLPLFSGNRHCNCGPAPHCSLVTGTATVGLWPPLFSGNKHCKGGSSHSYLRLLETQSGWGYGYHCLVAAEYKSGAMATTEFRTHTVTLGLWLLLSCKSGAMATTGIWTIVFWLHTVKMGLWPPLSGGSRQTESKLQLPLFSKNKTRGGRLQRNPHSRHRPDLATILQGLFTA